MNSEIAGREATETDLGWYRAAVWQYDSDIRSDQQVGDSFTAYYENMYSDDAAQITYWAEHKKARNQPGQPMRYTVECCIEMGKKDKEYGFEISEYEYDYGDVRFFGTEEAAVNRARELALRDESHVFTVDGREKING